MSAILVADSIGRAFGRRRVLTAASVWVRAGRIGALLGRNGTGKSTLVRILGGVLRADHGTVRFRGRTIRRPRLHRLAREGLFYLPERGLLAPLISVREHLERLRLAFGAVNVDDVVDTLRLGCLLDATRETMSTGERRRAELALALVRAPVCLLVDEPLMGIAPRDIDIIADGLRTLAGNGCAILVTGHEVRALLDLSDEVVWMAAGTTHVLGPPEEALRHDSFRRDYLGPAAGSLQSTARNREYTSSA